MNATEFDSLQRACDTLIQGQQSLLLATSSTAGDADIGYAPFVYADFCFYIFVSTLARHTQNLLSNPKAAVLLIEPEAEASNPFARQRLTFDCRVEEIAKSDSLHDLQLQAMTTKFGETMTLLRSLPDFHLMRLTPHCGRFVAGFGKAFAVDRNGHLQPSSRTG